MYEDPFHVRVSAYNNLAAQLEDAQGEIRALRATEQNLRDRLAQVEAEHEALKKAISDAEPVLWMDADTKVLYEHDTTEVDKFHGFKPTIPLYTLEGIRTKP